MGINLSGIAPRGERVQPGSYAVRAVKDSVERCQSKSDAHYEQVKWFWRITGGRSTEGEDFTGAEQRDMVTFTGNGPMLQEFVNLTYACELKPSQEFASLEAMADWLAEQMQKEPAAVIIVRDKANRDGKVYAEIAGYRRVKDSDISSNAADVTGGPKVNGNGNGSGAKAEVPF